MTAAELAEKVSERILGIGAEQYSKGDVQRFETVSVRQLLVDVIEEHQDALVYEIELLIRLEAELERLDELMFRLGEHHEQAGSE